LKEKVRPIYLELMGYLTQTPPSDKIYSLHEESLWQNLNTAIEELNQATGKNYDKFKVVARYSEFGTHRLQVPNDEFRSKINGLIMNLYGEFFPEDSQPFSGQPSMVVNQTNSQNVQVTILLEMQGFIDKKLLSKKLEIKEKTFLEKIKLSLPNVKNTVELIGIILNLAKDFGLSIHDISKLFR